MRARAAWAAVKGFSWSRKNSRVISFYLVFAIMLSVGNEASAARTPRLPYVTEFAPPAAVVNIGIINVAIQIEAACLILSISECSKCIEINRREMSAVSVNNGAACTSDCVQGILISIAEIIRQPRAKRDNWLPIDNGHNILCRRLAKILYCRRDKILVDEPRWNVIGDFIIQLVEIGQFGFDFMHSDVGTQLAAFGIFSGSSHFICRGSQTNCEESEYNSEYGNKEGADSNHFFMVTMDKSPQFTKPDFESSIGRGAIIYIGLCCMVAFACLFWWLITR